MTNHPNRGLRSFNVTTYYPGGDRVQVVRAASAKDAVLTIARVIEFQSFTALDEQHGFGRPWLDNAHAQTNQVGTGGIYARIAK